MREKLVRDIKKKYGPVLGSKKLKEQRKEIITNALDRYDEEIANGASDRHAYNTVYFSLGDLAALRNTVPREDMPVSAKLSLILGGIGLACFMLRYLPTDPDSWLSFTLVMIFFITTVLAPLSILFGVVGIAQSLTKHKVIVKGILFSALGICCAAARLLWILCLFSGRF